MFFLLSFSSESSALLGKSAVLWSASRCTLLLSYNCFVGVRSCLLRVITPPNDPMLSITNNPRFTNDSSKAVGLDT